MRNYDGIMSIYNMMSILDAHKIAYVKDTINKKARLAICGNKATEVKIGHCAILVYFDGDGCYVHHIDAPMTWEVYGGNDDIGNGKKMIETCNCFNNFGNYKKRDIRMLLRDINSAIDYK